MALCCDGTRYEPRSGTREASIGTVWERILRLIAVLVTDMSFSAQRTVKVSSQSHVPADARTGKRCQGYVKRAASPGPDLRSLTDR